MQTKEREKMKDLKKSGITTKYISNVSQIKEETLSAFKSGVRNLSQEKHKQLKQALETIESTLQGDIRE